MFKATFLAVMSDSMSWSKLIGSVAVGGVLTALFGEATPLLFALFVLFFIDTITSIWIGIIKKKCDSLIMLNGATKFVIYCLSIIMAHQFAVIPLLGWIETALIALLALNELNYIGSNIRCLGFPFPTLNDLKDVFKKAEKNNTELKIQ